MNDNFQKDDQSVNEGTLQVLSDSGLIKVSSCDSRVDLSDDSKFKRLETGSLHNIQLSALGQNVLPSLATNMVSNAYRVEFPEGLPHALTVLKQGGFGSMIKGESGRFVGSASFYKLSTEAVIMGSFTAMSIASGQYFLAQINDEMKMMNLKLDDILEFLYGDKKAELVAELSFIKYAYENYGSIMEHEHQRSATIASLQDAKIVAMKDIEFYINDLEKTVTHKVKDFADLIKRTNKSLQIKECLSLSQQLYVMSSMMEIFYAQNMDSTYLKYIEKDILSFIDKCDKRMLASFSTLKGLLDGYKGNPLEKVDKSKCEPIIESIINDLNDGEESSMRKAVRSALHAQEKKTEYFIDKSGDVYLRA